MEQLLGKEIKYTGHDFDQWEGHACTNAELECFAPPHDAPSLLRPRVRLDQTEVARLAKRLGHTPRSYEEFATETAQTWKSMIHLQSAQLEPHMEVRIKAE